MKYIVGIFLLHTAIVCSFGQTPEWFQRIQKLQKFPSSEQDVVRLFRSPSVVRATTPALNDPLLTKVIDYDVGEGILSVFFSGGRCSPSNTEGYDLENGTIISFYFDLKTDVDISKVNLDLRKFTKVEEGDSAHVYYVDPKKRLRYTVLGDKLQEINYSIPKNRYRRCKDSSLSEKK